MKASCGAETIESSASRTPLPGIPVAPAPRVAAGPRGELAVAEHERRRGRAAPVRDELDRRGTGERDARQPAGVADQHPVAGGARLLQHQPGSVADHTGQVGDPSVQEQLLGRAHRAPPTARPPRRSTAGRPACRSRPPASRRPRRRSPAGTRKTVCDDGEYAHSIPSGATADDGAETEAQGRRRLGVEGLQAGQRHDPHLAGAALVHDDPVPGQEHLGPIRRQRDGLGHRAGRGVDDVEPVLGPVDEQHRARRTAARRGRCRWSPRRC